MKTKVAILLALALLLGLSACGASKEAPAEPTPPVSTVPVSTIPADPTDDSDAAYDEDGMKSEYIYTFPAGEIEVPLDAYLVMINGEFIAEYAASDDPTVIATYADGLENAVVTRVPAGVISKEPIIVIDTVNPVIDTATLVAELKPQLQAGFDALKAADFETFSSGRLANLSEETFSAAFDEIQAKIDGFSFIMQAGRYAIFDGPHTLVVDTAANNALYRHYSGHAYGGLCTFDSSDPEVFLSGYFYG